MEPVSALSIVALLAATTLCGFGVWAAIEVARTAREVRESVEQATERLVPLLDKADITVDAVNAELLRVDAIITQFEDAGAKVSHASGTISEIVNAPGEIVSEVAVRVRRAWKDRKRAAEESAARDSAVSPDDEASVEAQPTDSQHQLEE